MLEIYKLGIEIIDEQHQKIFDMIESLNINIDDDSMLPEIMKELNDYSIQHFKTEEKYFKNLEFNDMENHIHLHDMFSQTINFYLENSEQLNKKKIYTFLQSWIKNHILIEDKKYTIKENIK